MSKRERNMKAVVHALRAYGPQTYHELTKHTGLSAAAVSRSVVWLSQEDGMVIGLPCHGNDYKVSLGWADPARRGEANQARHNSTRNERQAVRMMNAASVAADPSEAALLRSMARIAAAHAENERDLAEALG